jgi:hypothetical protein
MPEVKITKNTFRYGQEGYFRGSAERVRLGDYGRKKDPIGARASLEIFDQVARENLTGRVRYVTTAVIDWSRQSKVNVDIEGNLQYLTANAGATASFSYERAKSANLKLMQFTIVERDVLAMLNQDAGAARKYLASEGPDGRLVTTVWIVVDGRLAESFSAAASSGGSVSAKLTSAAEIEVTAKHKASSSASTTVQLKKGTCFAFLMHKVTDWNKDKTRVEQVRIDSKGLD